MSELLTLQSTSGLDQIVLANPKQTGALLHTLSICHEGGAQITPMFALYQDLTGRVPITHLGQHWYVALPANIKKTNRPYLLFKRLFDFTLAFLGLVVALPLLPFVALAIKLTRLARYSSARKGWVLVAGLFRSSNCGRWGRTRKPKRVRSGPREAIYG